MELADFKDKHLGERCFVLGCGPSLAKTDLDLIVDETSFAMNNIRLIYPYTKWRPTYYWNSTKQAYKRPHWRKCADDTVRDGTVCFIKEGSPIIDGPNVFRYKFNYLTTGGDKIVVAWSKDITNIVVHFKLSFYGLMQLVTYMGFKKVYLLGFDNNFKVGHNHFTDDYEGSFVWTEEGAAGARYWQEIGHKYVRKYTRALGVEVYDCTVDGLLDVWPKLKLEDVLCGENGQSTQILEDISPIC